MRWSITLGSFKGTAIRIHITFLMLLAWIGFSAYSRGGAPAARDSLLFIVTIFACVLLHEFGHILTARRYGIVSPEVTLLPIGGVADMERMPEKPSQELLVALAGPAVNVAIAAALVGYLAATEYFQPASLQSALDINDSEIRLLPRLAAANLFLAAFNLIPAFPMDGGRVLRAALSMWMDRARATRVAAQIGQILAFLLGFLGLFGNPLLLFIAIFIYIAAAGESQMTTIAEAARGVAAADAMETRIAVLGRGATVGEAVETLLATSQDDFPVVDSLGRLHGMLSRADIVAAMSAADPGAPVASFVTKAPATIDAAASADTALPAVNGGSAVGVIDGDGRLLGLITRQSLAEIMMIRDAWPDWPLSRRAPSPPVA